MGKTILCAIGGTGMMNARAIARIAATGIYGDEEIEIFLWDKDTGSPTYKDTCTAIKEYQDFYNVVKDCTDKKNNQIWKTVIKCDDNQNENDYKKISEDMFGNNTNQTVKALLNDNNSEKAQYLLNMCFDKAGQEENLSYGNFGRADIGSTVCKINKIKGYKKSAMIREIESTLRNSSGGVIKVVICYSSFGGTGASLGDNIASYIYEKFEDEKKNGRLKVYGIHVLPYFKTPENEPSETDKEKTVIDSGTFHSRTSETLKEYANRCSNESFIKPNKEEENGKAYVFDGYNFVGWNPMDEVDKNYSVAEKQNRRPHLIDMLVALIFADIVGSKNKDGIYNYSFKRNERNEAVEYITWNELDVNQFKNRGVSLLRFSVFVKGIIEQIVKLRDTDDYEDDTLIRNIKKQKGDGFDFGTFNNDLDAVIKCCDGYIKYIESVQSVTGSGGIVKLLNTDKYSSIVRNNNNADIGENMGIDLCEITYIGGANVVSGKKLKIKRIYNNLDVRIKADKMVAGELMGLAYTKCKI